MWINNTLMATQTTRGEMCVDTGVMAVACVVSGLFQPGHVGGS